MTNSLRNLLLFKYLNSKYEGGFYLKSTKINRIDRNNKRLRIYFLALTWAMILVLMNPVHAETKSINTDRGKMEAFIGGGYLSSTGQKYVDYTSRMTNGSKTRLYLKSSTYEYRSGKSVHSVPRFGGPDRNYIQDYFYLKGYSGTGLTTYSTHEAIYTNAHSIVLVRENY